MKSLGLSSPSVLVLLLECLSRFSEFIALSSDTNLYLYIEQYYLCSLRDSPNQIPIPNPDKSQQRNRTFSRTHVSILIWTTTKPKKLHPYPMKNYFCKFFASIEPGCQLRNYPGCFFGSWLISFHNDLGKVLWPRAQKSIRFLVCHKYSNKKLKKNEANGKKNQNETQKFIFLTQCDLIRF